MIAVAFLAIGAVTSALLWIGMRPTLQSSAVLRRRNYRDHELPVAAGVVVVLAVVAVQAAYALIVRRHGLSAHELGRGATVLGGATLGFGLIGLLDDLVGGVTTKGFRGHIAALLHGQITTGLVKLVFGVVVGILTVALDRGDVPGQGPGLGLGQGLGQGLAGAVRGGMLIAATANLANLFDRAPGRVIKVSLVGAALVALLGAPGWHLTGPMLIVGAGVGLLVPDLREDCMLGDTGSNVLGAAIGWGLVISLAGTGEWIAFGVVVALNLISEFVSFTRVIDAVAPLRWLDRLGALPERRNHPATIRAASGGPSI